MSDRDRNRTFNGLFDSRCITCGLRVYTLWVDKEAPPPGCCEGKDATPLDCAHVYGMAVSCVIAADHLGGLKPHHEEFLAKMPGGAVDLLHHIRTVKDPQAWMRRHKKRGRVH